MYNMEKTRNAFKYDGQEDQEPPSKYFQSSRWGGPQKKYDDYSPKREEAKKPPAPSQMSTFDFNEFALQDTTQVKKAEYIKDGSKSQGELDAHADMFNFGKHEETKNIVKKFVDLLNLNLNTQHPTKVESKTEEFNFDFGPAEGTTKVTNS